MPPLVTFQGKQHVLARMRDFDERLREEVLVLLHAEAPLYLDAAQDQTYSEKRWTDITGNARNTLNVQIGRGDEVIVRYEDEKGNTREEAIGDDHDDLVLVLAHGRYYGQFLEEANEGLYATVIPTMNALAPLTMGNLLDLVED